MALPTVRITELPALTTGLPLALTDRVPIWIESENKTKKVTLQQLNAFFAIGGGGTAHAPVMYGGELIYKVPLAAAGSAVAPIPTLAGKDFTLERGGMPMIALLPDNSNLAEAEYEVLDSGGFQLLQSGDALVLNERFKLTVYSLIGAGPSGGGTTTISSFIVGKKNVASDVTLDPVTDANKLIQVRGNTVPIAVTLPDVDDIAVNTLFPIETTINNSKPCTISTTGGQLIYFNGISKTSIFLMPGEVCWLFRDVDGFYIINDFAERYKNLAKPLAAYQADLNQLVCKGQLVNRADYPRLWEYVQTLGTSLVSDATWSTASVTVAGRIVPNPYRGCFSTGDGSTTFRVPDLMNMFLRGVLSESGTDPDRSLNKPGGFQDDQMKKFWGGTPTRPTILHVDGTFTESAHDTDPGFVEPNLGSPNDVDKTLFGNDTHPMNVGVLWVINV